MRDSLTDAYAGYLHGEQTPRWKRVLDVQAPYRWNLKRLRPGFTLDVGCGIGRNLRNLDGIGVDPNPGCVAAARAQGLRAYTPDDLPDLRFDSLLFAHVLEHVSDPLALVNAYLPRLKPGGRLIAMTPQEWGFRADPTHVTFLDLQTLGAIAEAAGLVVESACSFPFPRWAGPLFRFNEFVLTARAPGG